MMKIGDMEITETGELDAAWLSDKLSQQVAKATVQEFTEKMGGLSGEFSSVMVELSNGSTTSFIFKTTHSQKTREASLLGTPREALFFQHLGPSLEGIIPKSYYTYADMAKGIKLVVMEQLPNAIPAGMFFGRGNPNNWGMSQKQLDDASEGNPSAVQLSRIAFSLYAKLHANYWKDTNMLQHTWLRGTDWFQGHGHQSWSESQTMAADAWKEMKESIASQASAIQWDPHTVACLDESMKKISWDTFQKQNTQRACAWTVVHGDCHPHNCMWMAEPKSLRLIDFEMVGIGSPAQELGQFLISHMEPALRKQHERELVKGYHTELVANLKARGLEGEALNYSLDVCWNDYVQGGAGRWLWFVPYLAKVCPMEMGQFFHDQLTAFLKDHISDPSQVGMPRV